MINFVFLNIQFKQSYITLICKFETINGDVESFMLAVSTCMCAHVCCVLAVSSWICAHMCCMLVVSSCMCAHVGCVRTSVVCARVLCAHVGCVRTSVVCARRLCAHVCCVLTVFSCVIVYVRTYVVHRTACDRWRPEES